MHSVLGHGVDIIVLNDSDIFYMVALRKCSTSCDYFTKLAMRQIFKKNSYMISVNVRCKGINIYQKQYYTH